MSVAAAGDVIAAAAAGDVIAPYNGDGDGDEDVRGVEWSVYGDEEDVRMSGRRGVLDGRGGLVERGGTMKMDRNEIKCTSYNSNINFANITEYGKLYRNIKSTTS